MRRKIRIVDGVPPGGASEPRFQWRKLRDVLAPMRDGIMLATDLLLPDAPGPLPAILVRTPYNKVRTIDPPSGAILEELAKRGYAVAVQDCRGRYNSDGDFDPYRQEAQDGYDAVEWLAGQPWCNGRVGMIGGSYNGQTQWLAASLAPPSLKAIVPTTSPPGHPFLNEPITGGAMTLAAPEWVFKLGRRSEHVAALEGLFTSEESYFEALPLSAMAEAAGCRSPFWEEWLNHPTYDDYWRSHGYEEGWPFMTVPALNITGWWDMNFPGAPRNFAGMRSLAATAEGRDGQRLVIGPWSHWVNHERELNGRDFGPGAITDLRSYVIRFLDHWVGGKHANRLDEAAPVHLFVTGANQWWEADEWPLPGTKFTPFFFHSDGHANSHEGDGGLSTSMPGSEPADHFISDPGDPVRTIWNLHDGPVDDRPVSARDDVLCYTSAPLEAPLDVVGPVRAILFAASTARDCDWHVRLVDVEPDGAARFLCHGVLRARFRSGFERCDLLVPGEVTRFEIDMMAVGIRFQPGHRIRVEVASSWFSRFDRNKQTGAANWMRDEGEYVVARQAVHHDDLHPSHVILPVIPAAPAR